LATLLQNKLHNVTELWESQVGKERRTTMPHEATSPEKFGTRMASQIGNAASVAGEKLDAAIGYTKEKTQAFKESAHHLVDDGWSELREKAGKVPITPLLVGLGAGFCLGWFIRHHTSADQ
jgi:hypothetical protein